MVAFLLFLLCASQGIGIQPVFARSRNIRNSADTTLQVNFTLQRVLEIGIPPKRLIENEFCSEVDRPDNITLEVFYLARDAQPLPAASSWRHSQTITSGLYAARMQTLQDRLHVHHTALS